MAAKLQHYVPRFYLRAFAPPERPDMIWVYEKGSTAPRFQAIKGSAAETHYYSLDSLGGGKDDVIESEVLSRIETLAAPVIERLRVEKRPILSSEEASAMTAFLATLFCRSPRFQNDAAEVLSEQGRKMARKAVQNEELVQRFLAENADDGLTRKRLLEAVEAAQDPERMSIEFNRDRRLLMSVMLAEEIQPHFLNRRWALLTTSDGMELIRVQIPNVFRINNLQVFSLHEVMPPFSRCG